MSTLDETVHVDVVRGEDPATLLRLPDAIPDLPVPVLQVFVTVELVGG